MLLINSPTGIISMYRVCMCITRTKRHTPCHLERFPLFFGTLPIIYSNTLLVRPFEFSLINKLHRKYIYHSHLNVCMFIHSSIYASASMHKCILNNEINCLSHFCIYFVFKSCHKQTIGALNISVLL